MFVNSSVPLQLDSHVGIAGVGKSGAAALDNRRDTEPLGGPGQR